jgi:hypothetical protein
LSFKIFQRGCNDQPCVLTQIPTVCVVIVRGDRRQGAMKSYIFAILRLETTPFLRPMPQMALLTADSKWYETNKKANFLLAKIMERGRDTRTFLTWSKNMFLAREFLDDGKLVLVKSKDFEVHPTHYPHEMKTHIVNSMELLEPIEVDFDVETCMKLAVFGQREEVTSKKASPVPVPSGLSFTDTDHVSKTASLSLSEEEECVSTPRGSYLVPLNVDLRNNKGFFNFCLQFVNDNMNGESKVLTACVEEINSLIATSDKHRGNKEICCKLLNAIHELEGNADNSLKSAPQSPESDMYCEEGGEIISCTQKPVVETSHEIEPGAGVGSLKQYLIKKRDLETYSYQKVQAVLESKKKQKADVAAKLEEMTIIRKFCHAAPSIIAKCM